VPRGFGCTRFNRLSPRGVPELAAPFASQIKAYCFNRLSPRGVPEQLF